MNPYVLTLAAALGLAALPAHAGLFDDEPARARIQQLATEHTARLEKLEAASRGQLELASQIEILRADVAKLRGQIEVLTFEAEQSQKRQKDFYIDLDNRLRKLESPPVSAQTPKADPVAEARDYEAALNLFKGGKYKDALKAFEGFLKTYASSSFVPSAMYWSGQTLYQLRDCRKAVEVFNNVSTTWPEDPKAADAMLGSAICQIEVNDLKNARLTLDALIAKYPSSPAAAAAKDRLKHLRK